MAIQHIDILRDQLPEVFEDKTLPTRWDDDFFIWSVDKVEDIDFWTKVEEAFFELQNALNENYSDQINPESCLNIFAGVLANESFPGSPIPDMGTHYPPPDALAFYLPFHYFHPTWWGIYLTIEGIDALTKILGELVKTDWSRRELAIVSRVFLFSHESFHHQTESFATRLEISHRGVFYRDGFEELYAETLGTDDCLEEALATAYAFRRVKLLFKSVRKTKLNDLLRALKRYIRGLPPGYRRALDYIENEDFVDGRCSFAEKNLQWCLPAGARCHPELWKAYSYSFRGMINMNSRVNYILSREHPMARRVSTDIRPLTYRDVSKRLKKAKCEFVGPGKGSHMTWQNPEGRNFPVPRHPGDFRRGTLRSVIEQAGLKMSLSQFQAMR